MKSIANGLVAAGNSSVRTNQAIVFAGRKLTNLRPDIQWMQGGKVVVAEITSLTGKAAREYHRFREAQMKAILGNAFGGDIKLFV